MKKYQQSISVGIYTGFPSGFILGILWVMAAHQLTMANLPEHYWGDIAFYGPFNMVLSLFISSGIAMVISYLCLSIIDKYLHSTHQQKMFVKYWPVVWTSIITTFVFIMAGSGSDWNVKWLFVGVLGALLAGVMGSYFGNRQFMKAKFDYL